MAKAYAVYIITNFANTTLYIGFTVNLAKRIYEHKNKVLPSFSSRYQLTKLVYYEQFDDPRSGIQREKQLKAGSRKKKLDLILKINPNFSDLYESIL